MVKNELELGSSVKRVIAILLSMLFPGLGQLATGRYEKGKLYFIIAIISIPLAFLLIGVITYIITWIVSLFDAAKNS